MSTKFSLREPESTSLTSIIVRTRWKKEQLVYSTGKKVKPSDCIFQKNRSNEPINTIERISKSCPVYSELNAYLKNESTTVEKALIEYERLYGEVPTSKQFKGFLIDYRKSSSEKDSIKHEDTFFSLLEKIIQEHSNRLAAKGKTSDRNSVCQAYVQTAKILKEFEKSTRCKVTFDNIDLDFYFKFIDWCVDEKKYSTNNTGKHIKNVKAVMNEALERELTTNTKHLSKKFKVLKEDVSNVYLTEDELESLYLLTENDFSGIKYARANHEFSPISYAHAKALSNTRDLFLIGAWTGLRLSDFKRIEKRHIIDEQYIQIKTQKTEQTVLIPLQPRLKAILERHGYNLPKMADQKLNKCLKEVCQLAGINQTEILEDVRNKRKVLVKRAKFELITSHTARRSFATNRYKEGLEAITIMSITGHKTQSAFMKYIKATPEDHLKRMQLHYTKVSNSSKF